MQARTSRMETVLVQKQFGNTANTANSQAVSNSFLLGQSKFLPQDAPQLSHLTYVLEKDTNSTDATDCYFF